MKEKISQTGTSTGVDVFVTKTKESGKRHLDIYMQWLFVGMCVVFFFFPNNGPCNKRRVVRRVGYYWCWIFRVADEPNTILGCV